MSNSMEFSKDVAILLRRVDIDSDKIIYIPVDVIIGKSIDTKKFETLSGKCYLELSQSILNNSDKYCFVDDLTDIELMEMYGDIDTFSYGSAIKAYVKNYEGKIYLVSKNKSDSSKNDSYSCVTLKLDELDRNSSVLKINGDTSFADLSTYLSGLREVIQKLKLKSNDDLKNIKDVLAPFTDAFVSLWNELCVYEGIVDDKYIKHGSVKVSMSGKDVSNIKNSDLLKFNVKNMCKLITDTVIGQDEHVERLVYEVLRLSMIKKICSDKNSGILLTGSTGVGKTKILTILGELLDRPVLFIDSTQLSIPGYVGMSIEDFLQRLYNDEKGDMVRISNAIVVFDEIDKKGSSKNEDVSGRGVLNTLLKFLDGTTYSIKEGPNISTDNMITIFSGAFSNVYNYNETSKHRVGFLDDEPDKKTEISLSEFMKKSQFPDESIGRFPVIIHLNSLNEQTLIDILKFSDESDIKIQQYLLNELGFDLIIDDTYYKALAHVAYKSGTGARALQKCVLDSTSKVLKYAWDCALSGKESDNTIIITGDTVFDPSNFIVKSCVDSKVKKY